MSGYDCGCGQGEGCDFHTEHEGAEDWPVVGGEPGMHVKQAIINAMQKAPCQLSFNGTVVDVLPENTAEEIFAAWNERYDHKAAKRAEFIEEALESSPPFRSMKALERIAYVLEAIAEAEFGIELEDR